MRLYYIKDGINKDICGKSIIIANNIISAIRNGTMPLNIVYIGTPPAIP